MKANADIVTDIGTKLVNEQNRESTDTYLVIDTCLMIWAFSSWIRLTAGSRRHRRLCNTPSTTSIVRRAQLRQENRCAWSKPLRRNSAHSTGSCRSLPIWRAMSAGSLGSQNRAASPHRSSNAGMREATTGHPQAIASIGGRPEASYGPSALRRPGRRHSPARGSSRRALSCAAHASCTNVRISPTKRSIENRSAFARHAAAANRSRFASKWHTASRMHSTV